jgi:hypothetical protein
MLTSDSDVQQTGLLCLFMLSSSLATALGMNRLKKIVLMNLVTVCGTVYVSDAARQKLMLSCSFRCEQIHKNRCNLFVNTLYSCLRLTQMFSRLTSSVCLC